MSQMQQQLDDVLGEFFDSNDPLLEQLTQNAQLVKLGQDQKCSSTQSTVTESLTPDQNLLKICK